MGRTQFSPWSACPASRCSLAMSVTSEPSPDPASGTVVAVFGSVRKILVTATWFGEVARGRRSFSGNSCSIQSRINSAAPDTHLAALLARRRRPAGFRPGSGRAGQRRSRHDGTFRRRLQVGGGLEDVCQASRWRCAGRWSGVRRGPDLSAALLAARSALRVPGPDAASRRTSGLARYDERGRQAEPGVAGTRVTAPRRVRLQCHDRSFWSRRPARSYDEGDAYEGYEEDSLARDHQDHDVRVPQHGSQRGGGTSCSNVGLSLSATACKCSPSLEGYDWCASDRAGCSSSAWSGSRG